MKSSRTIIALCYDFDGTLSAGNIQEYSFIPRLQKSPREFWERTQQLAADEDADEILAYMRLMYTEADKADIKIRKSDFMDFGKEVKLFKGLLPSGGVDWFSDINSYARSLGAEIRHYIISSGIKEMIEGTPIADKFHKIYASSFMYDRYGAACWPALAVNYTTKMQFLFRINKGILEIQKSINDFMPENERPVPFRRMIYFGDGSTDIPAMKLVKTQGGYSIAVHGASAKKRRSTQKLLSENRVNFVAEADYTPNSTLTKQVKRVIAKICAEREVELQSELKSKREKNMENFLDKFKSMALEGYLKKHFSKYLQDGAVSVCLDSENSSCVFKATLAGESAPLTINVKNFKIADKGADKFLVVTDVECDKLWLNNLLCDYVKNREIKLPSFMASAL